MGASSRPEPGLCDTLLLEVRDGSDLATQVGPPPGLSTAARLINVGQRIGDRYVIERHLSDGGMGVVYLASDSLRGEPVAVKVMRPEFREKHDVSRFRREYYLMATLRHPRLVDVLDFSVTPDGAPCLVMEYVEGRDLQSALPMSWQECARVLAQVASALAFLHARRYIHHDIKPRNVRINGSGETIRAKLVDFGIMEPIGSPAKSQVAGTLPYLPPEALFRAAIDHRLDLYSLGVMAVEMLTGQLPFKMLDPQSFLVEKQLDPPDVRSLLGADVPPELKELVADLMAVDAMERPYDAAVVLRRLQRAAPFALLDECEGTAPHYLRPSRLVGRDKQLSRLSDSEAAARLSLVSGDEGSGKSALQSELALRLRVLGSCVAEVSALGVDGPFAVLRQTMRELLGRMPSEAARALELSAPQLVRILPELRDRFPDLVVPAPHPDPGEDRSRLVDALRSWLGSWLRVQRIAILVDDVELADAASLDMLHVLNNDPELQGLRLVLAQGHRRAASATLKRLARDAEPFELTPFAPADVGELLLSLFGSVTAYPRVVGTLAEASGGNAALLIELLRRLVADGTIEYRDERWQLPQKLVDLPLPQSITEAVAERLTHASADAERLLRLFAAAGRALPQLALAELSELGERELVLGLDELVGCEALVASGDDYRLAATVHAEALYSRIPNADRPKLHLRIARVMEPSWADQRPAELARHFRIASRRGEAEHYLRRACDELYESRALDDALPCLLELEALLVERGAETLAQSSDAYQALLTTRQRLVRAGVAIDSDIAERFCLLERRAFLAETSGGPPAVTRLGGLVRLLGGELKLAIKHKNPARLLELEQRLKGYFAATAYHCAILALQGNFREALWAADTLKPLVVREHSAPGGAHQLCRALPLAHQGRAAEAERALLTALECMQDERLTGGLDPVDIAAGVGGALTCLTLVYAARGRPEAKRWLGQLEAYVALREEALRFLRPNLFLAQLEYHLHRGEAREVAAVEQQIRQHHARVGSYNQHVEAQILVSAARGALASHRLSDAEALCAELDRRHAGDFFSRGWGACVSGELWRLHRLNERARSALEAALSYAERDGQRAFKLELRVLNAMAELAIVEGDFEQAEARGRSALYLARRAESRSEYEEVFALQALAAAALARGLEGSARARLAGLDELRLAGENPLFSAIASKTRAEIERRFGNVVQASHEASQAADLFEALGYEPTTLSHSRASARTPSGSSPRIEFTGGSWPFDSSGGGQS